jgi:hypothetical protein
MFCFVYYIPLARNLHNLEPLALTIWCSQRSTEVRLGWATHTRHKIRAQHAHKSQLELTTQPKRVLYSNGALVAITKNQMRGIGVLVLTNAQRILGVLLHALRGPFYSPKAARSRWEHSRKAILAFCRLAHQTVWCTTGHCPVQISFLLWRSRPLGIQSRWRTGQSGAPPDSPVIYSRTPPSKSREQLVDRRQPGAPDTVWCTTGQSGAPRPSSHLAVHSQLLHNCFSCF